MSPAQQVAHHQPVAWDSQSRSWQPCAPFYAAQPTQAGQPIPCPVCGTPGACTHAYLSQV